MADTKIKKFGNKLLKSDKLIFTFLRSGVSSQASGWTDMLTGIILVAVGVSPWIATPIGAVTGGIVNCCMNYKFTFRAEGCSKQAVAIKYLLVWVGSLLLNTVGTALLADVLDRWHLLETWGFTNVGSYAAARLIVSLVVSWFWNFLLQRWFVYRSVAADKYLVKFCDTCFPHLSHPKTTSKQLNMKIKSAASNMRNSLQHGIYRLINPFVHFMIRMGVTPNMVSTIGFLGSLSAAAVLVNAGIAADDGLPYYGHLIVAGALIIGFSLFDMLDGQVARIGNMATPFGAMYDSILDRYSELFTLGAIAYYMTRTGHETGALITFAALIGSIMVSYVRARAEGAGIQCAMGFMQRPERVVITSLAILATGITGQCTHGLLGTSGGGYDATIILTIAMAFIAVFANMTAIARILYSKKELKKQNRQN